jgi:hypothetical protein
MSFHVGVGQAIALDGREACTQAIHQALNQIEHQSIALSLILASHEYDIHDVLGNASALLGNTPLIGFSTYGEIFSTGNLRRSVVIAILAGDGVSARAEWYPDFADQTAKVTRRMVETMKLDQQGEGTLFLVADGLNGDGEILCSGLPPGDYTLVGCLAGGDLQRGRTYQIGGMQAGTGGLSAALITGAVRTGVGLAHGWQPVGAHVQVSRSSGLLIHRLDGRPAAETYSRLFGFHAREWAFPPLNTLVRLYPLGLEVSEEAPLLVRSPLRMESDGSLRMNTTIPEGVRGQLLIGSKEKCLGAAREAAQEALAQLKGARPSLALVFADISYLMLLEGHPGSEVDAVQEILGEDVPVVGGYTFGQLARPSGSTQPVLLNQHIEVVLFAPSPV